MRTFSERARASGSDWVRGQVDPQGWARRYQINKSPWRETWLNYERDLEIQDDMDWLSEAVYQFYQVHLDRMIRKNGKLWGDFCRKRYVWNGEQNRWDEYLELSTKGCDMRKPTIVIPSTEKTVIPEPELHFSFSTTLMVMAIELYQTESERQFCHYVTYAHGKLVQFVESRKQMTAESYRFFLEHACSQFFQHESFHISARSKTKAKDIGASGTFHTSTKLSGYVWLGSETKLVHFPIQAGDVRMNADDEGDETANDLPSLSVKIQQDDHDEVQGEVQQEPQDEEQQDDEVYEVVQEEPMEGVCSQEGEETQEQPGYSDEIERPELPPARSPEDRYGNFIMSQFPGKEYLKLRELTFNLRNAVPVSERRGNPIIPQLYHNQSRMSTRLEWFGWQSLLLQSPILTS